MPYPTDNPIDGRGAASEAQEACPEQVRERTAEIVALASTCAQAIRAANAAGVTWDSYTGDLTHEQAALHAAMLDASVALQSACGDLTACEALMQLGAAIARAEGR